MNEYTSIFAKTLQASRMLPLVDHQKINLLLMDLADYAESKAYFILNENKKDLMLMNENDPKYDRLKLTKKRITAIADDIRNVAKLSSPLGKMLMSKSLPNGLSVSKITVPLGVVGIIYEARPNVTFDVFSLCIKSGNACLLKGGSDAINSNTAIISVIKAILVKHQLDPETVNLLPSSHQATEAMLNAIGYVDVIIPRGGQKLIDFVRQNAKIPVIETGAGIVHTYFDESADLEKGRAIIHNAKTRRVSVCNALDCLIIHKERLKDLPSIAKMLGESHVEIYADEHAYNYLKDNYPADKLFHARPEHFGTEFLSYKMAVKTVSNLQEALDHISEYSSKHSEAIISENKKNIDRFLMIVDAAAVYANTSTAFTDGAQFGLGAEIGISTQKLHARGPMALEELTSYKWIVESNGQIRNT
jgi:glutamate-5-semialdehyde dehydrogenase